MLVVVLQFRFVDNLGPHLLFSWDKPIWEASNEVWFMASTISHTWLWLIVDMLTTNLKEKILSSKIGWGIGITQMKGKLVPWGYGMEATTHYYYKKYIFQLYIYIYIYILLYFKFYFCFDLFLPCLGIWFIIYVGTIIIKALKNSDILFIFPFFALLVGLWILIFFFTILIFLYVSTIGLINTWEIGWCNW